MPDHQEAIPLSDAELDQLLTDLRADVPVNTEGLVRARARMMAAAAATTHDRHVGQATAPETVTPAPERGSSRRLRPWTAVAAAAVLVVLALLVPNLLKGRSNAVADVVAALNAAAAAIPGHDEPIQPGQYRYVRTHAWWARMSDDFLYLDEVIDAVWIPADPADEAVEWRMDRLPTGNRKWVTGTEADARAAGLSLDLMEYERFEDLRARCGAFFWDGVCDREGSWSDPTPKFLASLPRDPAQLYDRLERDAPDNDRGEAELLVYASDALRTGLIPADLRVALYQALTKVPSLQITERRANLDGAIGTAFAVDDGNIREEIIIDTTTGAFVGERTFTSTSYNNTPAGTLLESTAVTSTVVDELGDRQ